MPNDERFLVSGWEDDLNDIDFETDPHETPEKEILWAAENGDLQKAKDILDTNPDVINTSDKDGYTPLHRACYGNHTEMVDFLISRGADVHAKTQFEWRPLHSACQWNHKECVARLLQYGVDVNATSEGGQTPLHIAASHGASYDSVQLLLMHPYIQTDLKNNNNDTAQDVATRGSKYYHMFEVADPVLNGILDT